MIQKSTSLKYETSLEPLHSTVKQLFRNRGLYRTILPNPTPPSCAPVVNTKRVVKTCGKYVTGAYTRVSRPPPSYPKYNQLLTPLSTFDGGAVRTIPTAGIFGPFRAQNSLTCLRILVYLVIYMTLDRCPLSIFCSRGIPPRVYHP